MPNIIIANYSYHSLALIKWARANLDDFCVLSVDTGFAAYDWDKYLDKVFSWLEDSNINYYHLKAENTFQELVIARKQFPSQQFSWCAGFLKGITLLNKIDELDVDAEATIYLAHRKSMSKASQLLKEVVDEEEKYDFREVNYPLLNLSDNEIKELLSDLNFTPANISKECFPCIYATKEEFNSISTQDVKKVIQLESESNSNMFNNQSFNKIDSDYFKQKNIIQELSKACSWEYSCNL